MNNIQTLQKPVSAIGEEIGLELGNQMVNDYQTMNANDVHFYEIGRNIIDQILAQPGCAGMRLYNAYNEMGEKTLVYVGLNNEGKALISISTVSAEGTLAAEKGIVADRIKTGNVVRTSDSDDWNLTND
jgi:hypothetical protein